MKLIEVETQLSDSVSDDIPPTGSIVEWSHAPYQKAPILREVFAKLAQEHSLIVTVRIVDKEEMLELNSSYRNKPKPTNVLSFPFDLPEGIPLELSNEFILGDIIICAPVIREEAQEQHKSIDAHWAHMLIHGHLHLMGYDHIEPSDAELMEGYEIATLKSLGFPNPYHPLQPPSSHSTLNP